MNLVSGVAVLNQLKAASASEGVRPPCTVVNSLSHCVAVFAVVDDIDSGLNLLGDYLLDLIGKGGLEVSFIKCASLASGISFLQFQ